MNIGIIGISSLTLEMAFRSSEAGCQVKIYNPKGNCFIRELVQKMAHNAELCTLEQAADTDIVLLFSAKDDLQAILQNLPDMSGRIILHTSSLIFDPLTLLSSITSALTYKITASLLPTAHVVKLFNPVALKPKNTCTNSGDKDEIFFIADHRDTRKKVRDYLKKINFSPIDLSGRLHPQNTAFNLKSLTYPIKTNPFKNNLN